MDGSGIAVPSYPPGSVGDVLTPSDETDLHVYWWALRDSNPRPSPCKGGRNMQVKALTSASVVTPSTRGYLGVLLSRGAGVVRGSRAKSTPARILKDRPESAGG